MSRTSVAFALATVGALLALVVSPASLAQNNSRIITFQDAISIALEQNVNVRSAANAAKLSKVEVSEAKGQFLPDLRFSTNGSKNYGRTFDQTEGQIVDQTTKSMSLGLNSGVTLFDGFGNTATLKSAKLSDSAAEHELHRTRET